MKRIALLCGALALAGTAAAQTYPGNRPIKLVVPFSAGGNADLTARLIAKQLAGGLKTPVIVENRAGANGTVGLDAVRQAAPDGHTLLVTTSSVAAIGPVQGTNFNPATELDGVALLAKAPLIVLTPPSSPIRSIQDLVRMDRERPRTLNFATSGPGSTTHIATELFNLRAGTTLQHIPYRGTAGALTDLVAGRVDLMFTTIASAAGQLRGGLLRIIAYTSDDRPEGVPPAPSVKSTGIDYEFGIWWGLFAPRGLPPQVRQSLNEATNAALSDPGFARYLTGEGAIPSPMSADAFTDFLRAEVMTMREVVAAAKIRAN